MNGYFLDQAQGDVVDLGVISMRLLVPSAETNGTFAAAEFRGSPGHWTIPHVHTHFEESFYVLEGAFDFTLGEREVEAEQGAFVLVPRGTPHLISARAEGGTLLTIWTPGGLEAMFQELGGLPADSLTDPAVRAKVAKRFDSIPV